MTHFPSAQNDWQRAALAFPRHTEPQRAHCTRHRAPTAGGSVITVAPLRVHRIPQPTTSSASHSLGLACFSSRISVRVTHLSPLTHIPVASYIHLLHTTGLHVTHTLSSPETASPSNPPILASYSKGQCPLIQLTCSLTPSSTIFSPTGTSHSLNLVRPSFLLFLLICLSLRPGPSAALHKTP